LTDGSLGRGKINGGPPFIFPLPFHPLDGKEIIKERRGKVNGEDRP